MLVTILLFLAVLFVLVLVHEWGHYIVAKKTGMRVDEFGIGFPPRLFGFKKGETEYTLNTLPLGGFVRIYGEALEHDEAEAQPDVDRGRAMWQRPKWAQALVLVAGVTMNVVLAWVLYIAIFMIGTPVPVTEAEAGPEAQLYVAEILPGSPLSDVVPLGAAVTAVRAGDVNLDVLTPAAFSEFVQTHAEGSITIAYERGGEAGEATVTPVAGLISDNPERKAVGAALSLVEVRREGFFTALGSATAQTWNGLVAITVGIGALFGSMFVGQADLSQVAGPVGIAGMVGDAASYGIVALFSFVAIISLNLAIINLLPFPALDGGRLVLLGIEAVARRPVPPVWAHRLNAIGFILLLGLMVIVTYGDITRLL